MTTRLFVSAPISNGAELVIGGEQAHYLGRVLRAAVGDTVQVFNGDCGEWQATITAMSKNSVTVLAAARLNADTESPLRSHLVQGISRGERMDFVVQKATELGIKRITPVFTNHGVVRLDDKRAGKRREHWQRIAISATEQCGRLRPPLIDPPVSLNHWFGAGHAVDSTQLILLPGAATALSALDTIAEKVCLLIGPEGGFSEREIEDAGVAGFRAVSLGPRILRTETAALAALAVLQLRFGDL
ncbi:MAG TPA: 16S rRNA (uracil(1498)-N(3))-methyltransferase [Woeseiaceae bacterium]|nr:16S rRNA (uracil(1498)-N(3))-methyltransferase [Woeseiaceae bacterium]